MLNKHQEFCMFNSFFSKIGQKRVKIAFVYSEWVEALQAELSEFEINNVWRLISTPSNASVVGLKWIFFAKN